MASARFDDQTANDVMGEEKTAAPRNLTVAEGESLELSQNVLIGSASFLIRF